MIVACDGVCLFFGVGMIFCNHLCKDGYKISYQHVNCDAMTFVSQLCNMITNDSRMHACERESPVDGDAQNFGRLRLPKSSFGGGGSINLNAWRHIVFLLRFFRNTNSMVSKRRFWKGLQKMKCAFFRLTFQWLVAQIEYSHRRKRSSKTRTYVYLACCANAPLTRSKTTPLNTYHGTSRPGMGTSLVGTKIGGQVSTTRVLVCRAVPLATL